MGSRRGSGTRRAFVRGVGAAGLAGLAGCAGITGGTNDSAGGRTTASESATIAILAAGSLQNALSNGLQPTIDVPVRIEAHGSATVARLIAEGKRDPDIVSVADTALFDAPLSPPWHSVFASNAVVIAYNPDTGGGRRIAEAGTENWYEPMVNGDVSLGRTDPDQDPLGYRTLFTLELASRYYDGTTNLKEGLLRRDQIYPEMALISQFETGAIDAAFAYRNMAVERDYAYVELPDRIDLSNPKYVDEWYTTVSYTLPSGQTIRGGLISYGSTIRHTSDAALDVFAAHTTGEYLGEFGFVLRGGFPTYEGTVPERVERATAGSNPSRSADAGPAIDPGSTVSEITVLL